LSRRHVHDGQPEEAVRRAGRLLMDLPAEHRSPIVAERARRLLNLVPIEHRSLPAVQEYREVLALGASS
jgi:hypothetical protein